VTVTDGVLNIVGTASVNNATFSAIEVVPGSSTPSSLPGLQLWFKADALSLNDGDPVGTWADSSGHGWDATEATNRPTFKTNILNGKPIVRFDGVNDTLKIASGANSIFQNVGSGTIIAVCADTNPTGGGVAHNVFNVTTNPVGTLARAGLYTRQASVSQFSSRGRRLDADTGVNSFGTFASGFHMVVGQFNWAQNTNTLYLDGVAQTPTGFSSGGGNTQNLASNGVYISDANFFPGDIAEVIAFQPALSAADLVKVQNYLAVKYGWASPGSSTPTPTPTLTP
jgi:hypothetical protein